MPWAVIGLCGSDTFSSDYTFLRHNIYLGTDYTALSETLLYIKPC
jgi:hypothetical protein